MSLDPRTPRRRKGRRAPTVYTGKSEPKVPAVPDLADLLELLELSELDCPRESLPPLQRYLRRMLEENEKLNLSGIKDWHEALALHVVDSLYLWVATAKPPRVVLDIGSGNGFPGVAAASLWPDARVLLVERRQKKARAIADCAQDAGLANVETLALDAGQVPALHPKLRHGCDLVLSRATASLADIARLSAPLLRAEGLLVQWKAQKFAEEERREYERQQRRLGLKSREDLVYVIHAEQPRPRRLVSALKV